MISKYNYVNKHYQNKKSMNVRQFNDISYSLRIPLNYYKTLLTSIYTINYKYFQIINNHKLYEKETTKYMAICDNLDHQCSC